MVLGGRRGRELPQVIEQRRGELVTAARRQPRGEYKDTLDRASELEQRLVGQQQQQLEISDTLDQLAAAEDRLRRLEGGRQDRIDQKELEQAQDQLGEVERRDLQLEAARSELQNRQRQLEQAQHAQCERASRREELEYEKKQLRLEIERLEELQQQERESLVAHTHTHVGSLMSLGSGLLFGSLVVYGAYRTSVNPKDFVFLFGTFIHS